MGKFKAASQLKQVYLRGHFKMANIAISDLRSAGADLFLDSESFLKELTNDNLGLTHGGMSPLLPSIIIFSPQVLS